MERYNLSFTIKYDKYVKNIVFLISRIKEMCDMYKLKFKLKEVRKFKGMSQKRLAYLSNLSQSHISELEKNKQSPTLRTVEKVADALKTYPEDLLEKSH